MGNKMKVAGRGQSNTKHQHRRRGKEGGKPMKDITVQSTRILLDTSNPLSEKQRFINMMAECRLLHNFS